MSAKGGGCSSVIFSFILMFWECHWRVSVFAVAKAEE